MNRKPIKKQQLFESLKPIKHNEHHEKTKKIVPKTENINENHLKNNIFLNR